MDKVFTDLVTDIRTVVSRPDHDADLRALLEGSFSSQNEIADAIAATEEDEILLFEDETCSIWSCRFNPDVVMPPHEHKMTVHIAVYRGSELQVLYRRDPDQLRHERNRRVDPHQVLTLSADAVHAVTSGTDKPSHAIHVYEGPLTTIKRDLFDWSTGATVDFSMDNFHAMVRARSDVPELADSP